MSKLQDLQNRGVIGLHVAPIENSLLDKAGNAVTISAGAGLAWTKTRQGSALSIPKHATQGISVADSAANRLTGVGTLIVSGDFSNMELVQGRLISKRSVLGTNYDFLSSTATTLSVYDGTTTSSVTVASGALQRAHVVAVRFNGTASKPTFYLDGVYVGEGASNLSIASSNVAVMLGAYATPSNYSGAKHHRFIVCNTALSNQDIAELSTELMTERGAGDPKTSNYKWGINKVNDPTLVCHLDAGVRRADGDYVDLSGNGNNGQSKGLSASTVYPFGTVSKPNKINGVVGMGVMSSKASLSLGTNDFTYGGWFNTGSLVGISYAVAAYNSAPIIHFSLGVGGVVGVRISDGVNDITGSFAARLPTNTWAHIVVTATRGGNAILYVNNVLSLTLDISMLGSMTTANQLLLLANSSFAAPRGLHDGAWKEFRLYNGKALSAIEISNWYHEYADKLLYNAQPEYWTPTLANVTAGRIGNTDFNVSTGKWKVSEDSNKQKWIESASTGVSYKPETRAFGTVYFKAIKATDASDFNILFNSSVIGNYSATGQNGYLFTLNNLEGIGFYRILNASVAALFVTSVGYIQNGVEYEYAISRSLAGVFTAYIRGGAFTNWTNIVALSGANPVTDIGHLTNKFFSISTTGIGDKISDIRHYQGVLDLTTLPLN